MSYKKLSAYGVFQVRTSTQYSSNPEYYQENKKIVITDSNVDRFLYAKSNINEEEFDKMCEVLEIDKTKCQDRTPLEIPVDATLLNQSLAFYGTEGNIKSTLYNKLFINSIESIINNQNITVSGRWRAITRENADNHGLMNQTFEVIQSLANSAIPKINFVKLENQDLWEVHSEGRFLVKYSLKINNGHIVASYINSEIERTSDDSVFEFAFQNLTRLRERIEIPIIEYEIISGERLRSIIEQQVGHSFYTITDITVNDEQIFFKIDESFSSNRDVVKEAVNTYRRGGSR